MREDELARELRFVSTHGRGANFVHMARAESGSSRTVAHYSRSECSGAVNGGYALGNPIVRGGVHEFTFTLDVALPNISSRPAIGLRGERVSGPHSTQSWTCRLCISTGDLHYDDLSRANVSDWDQFKSGLACPVSAGSTITVRIHFEQQRISFAVNGSALKWFGPDIFKYVGVGFQPVSAQPYVEFGNIYAEERLLPVGQASTVSITSHTCLLAGSDIVQPTPPTSQLIMGIDPVGDVPYFYLHAHAA